MSLVIRERLGAFSANIWHFSEYVSHFNLVKLTVTNHRNYCRRVFDSAIVIISIKWSKTFRLWNLMNWVFPDFQLTYYLKNIPTGFLFDFHLFSSCKMWTILARLPKYLFGFLFFKKCNLSNLSTLFSNNLNDNSLELFALFVKMRKCFTFVLSKCQSCLRKLINFSTIKKNTNTILKMEIPDNSISTAM